MSGFDTLVTTIGAHNSWAYVIGIILATFIHEDLATIAVGMAVAEGVTTIPVALPALYAGIVLGDLGLYGLGRLIALNRFSTRLLNRRRFTAVKSWLDQHLMLGVVTVRFLPGLRLTAYATYGFFAMPLIGFFISVVLATSIWTTGLFYLSYAFGGLTERWLGYWRFPAVVLAFAVPLFLLRRLTRHEDQTPNAAPPEAEHN